MENSKLNSFDLQFYLQIIIRRKWILIVPAVVSFLAAIIVIANSEPVYESRSLVRIGGKRLMARAVESVVPGSRGIGSSQLLRSQILSYENVQRLIEQLNLKNDSGIEGLDERARNIKTNYPNVSVDEIKNILIVEKLRNDFSVKQSGSDFIEISARAKSSQQAYQLTKVLTAIFRDATLKAEKGGIRSAEALGSEQLLVYRGILEEKERELESYKQKIATDDFDDYQTLSLNITIGDSLISSITLAQQNKEIEIRNLDKQLDDFIRKIPLQHSDNFKKIKRELINNSSKLSTYSMKYSWREGVVIKLNQEISNQKNQLQTLIENEIKDRLRITDPNQVDIFSQKHLALIDLEILGGKKDAILKIRDDYRQKMKEKPGVMLKLNQMQQEVDRYRQLNDLFLQQVTGAAIEQAVVDNEAEYKLTIVEPAQKPIAPISPDKKKILAIGMFLGLAIGAGGIFGLETINQTYRDVASVEKDLGMPILGIVPKLELNVSTNNFLNFVMKVCIPIILSLILIFLILKFDLISVF